VRNPVEGNEGYGVLRVFGAVAALVALYGVSLSAAALMDPPREAREINAKPVVWYGPVASAMEQRSQLTSARVSAPARGGSFWITSETSGDASPTKATTSTAATASFWREHGADQAVNGSELAGDLDSIHGNM
jgi:hypothetical protein